MSRARPIRLFAAFLVVTAATVAPAQVVRQITDVKTAAAGPGALDDSGAAVYAGTSADLAGSNPSHAFQIVRFDPATGAAAPLTSSVDGASVLVSVSDDGQWVAFPSPADLTGGNHDQSVEIFVMRSDGTQITQLTSDPAPNAGSVSLVAMAGGASRVAFLANTDPLGTNPDHRTQMFVVNRDGSGLRQLTSFASGSIGSVSISDDGLRIAFAYDGDPTGGNADLGSEVFAVQSDGTGLGRLTATAAGFGSGSPSLSGNGARIAFQSNGDLVLGGNLANQDEIFAIDWAGTGLRQVTRTVTALGVTGEPLSQSPSITDDGVTIVYHSNQGAIFPPVNIDGNLEIFKIRNDGTGRTALTSSYFEVGSLAPVVSGNGGRIAYYSIDLAAVHLSVMDGAGGAKRDLVTFDLVFNSDAEITPDGTRAVFVRSSDLFGGGDLWRVETDGSGLAEVMAFSSGGPSAPSIAGDRETIVFASDTTTGGANADGSDEIFAIRADGTGLRQLTSGPTDTSSANPVVSENGVVVVFDSNTDPLGTNADLSREIFRVAPDGTALQQLTQGPAGTSSRLPRVDASGAWIVFESDADLDGGNPDGTFEVYRLRSDGSFLERLTGDALLDSRSPDLSATGDRVVWTSSSNPLGTNPESNSEVFSWDSVTGTLRQLTSTATGSSGGARISGDGQWVVFASNAPFFESDPDDPTDFYRVPAAGGTVQRIGALRGGAVDLGLGGGGSGLAVDHAAGMTLFSGIGDFTGQNKDALPEVWVIDRLTRPSIEVGRPAPTELSWPVESGPVRYDALRGDGASLRRLADAIDLGAVVCLENESPDADTVGFGDAASPAPGQWFFFLQRGSQGVADGPGSYGVSTDGLERRPSSGDCQP